jgi:hypothetical protein
MSGLEQLDSARMLHFRGLEHAQQAEPVRRLAALGQSEFTIARATGLSVEMIQRVLGEQSDSNGPTRDDQS